MEMKKPNMRTNLSNEKYKCKYKPYYLVKNYETDRINLITLVINHERERINLINLSL